MDKLQLLFITDLKLPATGLVNGKWQFSTPYNIQKWLQVITSAVLTVVPNLVQIRLCGLPGKWVKYIDFLTYLYLFSGTRLQVRPLGGFSRLTAQTTCTGVPFVGFGDIAPRVGS